MFLLLFTIPIAFRSTEYMWLSTNAYVPLPSGKKYLRVKLPSFFVNGFASTEVINLLSSAE